ncbi:MAG: hypothetical protein M3389_11600 [Actinomycetota bacterium]|nr:hypothetical protein [Actinomycetota bacterium]
MFEAPPLASEPRRDTATDPVSDPQAVARRFPVELTEVLKAATPAIDGVPAWWRGFSRVELRRPSRSPWRQEATLIPFAIWDELGSERLHYVGSVVFQVDDKELQELAVRFDRGRPAALTSRSPFPSFVLGEAI